MCTWNSYEYKINRYLNVLYPGFQRRDKFSKVYIRTTVKRHLRLKKENNFKTNIAVISTIYI